MPYTRTYQPQPTRSLPPRDRTNRLLLLARSILRTLVALSPGAKLTILVGVIGLAGLHGLHQKHVAAEAAAERRQQLQQVQRADAFRSYVNGIVAAHPELSLNVAVAGKTDTIQSYGDMETFDGASTGKLLTAAAYLSEVANGKTSLDHRIDGVAARQLLQRMLVNSDDDAWAGLNGFMTHPKLSAYARSIGWSDYDVTTNHFSARDVAGLLQKLYGGSLLPAAERSLMLSMMRQANYRDYIVASVPAGDGVYHKIGMDGDAVHDAAIETRGDTSMVLVIFTDGHGTYNWNDRAGLMKDIARHAQTAYL